MKQLIYKTVMVISLASPFYTSSTLAAEGGIFAKIKSLYSRSAQDIQQDKFATYQDFLKDVDNSCQKDCHSTLRQLEKFNSSYQDRTLEAELEQTRLDNKSSVEVPIDGRILKRLQSLFDKNPDSLTMRISSSFEGLKALLHLERENLRQGNTAGITEDSKFLFRQAQSLLRLQKILRHQNGNSVKLSEHDVRDIVSSINGLGITYVKLAQTITSLTQEVPENLMRVFKGLQAENTDLSPELSRQTLKTELGFDPNNVFRNLDLSQPYAKGSTSYTYTAEVQNARGEWTPVLIKVQRPDLVASMERSRKFHDIFLKFSQAAIAHLDLSPILSLVTDQVLGVEKSIQAELDYRHEARNMQRFAEYFKHSKEIVVPKVYSQHSTAKVLVMEQAQGQTLDINLRKVLNSFEAKGFDPKSVEAKSIEKTFSLLAENLTYMFLITKEMHADLRPENIITTLQEDERGLRLGKQMTVIDYGNTINTKGLILNPAFAGLHLLTGNAEGFTKRFLQLGSISNSSEQEILEIVEKTFAKHGIKKIDLATFLKQKGRFNHLSALREATLEIAAEAIKKHGYRPDSRYTAAARSLVPVGITMWTLGRRLDGLALARASLVAVSKVAVKGSFYQMTKMTKSVAEKSKAVFIAPRCEVLFR